jgi:hypothetical protein
MIKYSLYLRNDQLKDLEKFKDSVSKHIRTAIDNYLDMKAFLKAELKMKKSNVSNSSSKPYGNKRTQS